MKRKFSNFFVRKLEFVKIPAGDFIFGEFGVNGFTDYIGELEANGISDYVGELQSIVYLDEYWIARVPVTNRVWAKFIEESGYDKRITNERLSYLAHWERGMPLKYELDNPVSYINYLDTWAFCDFYGLELPSEAQWEKAARGTDGRLYPWGDEPPNEEFCNFNMNVRKLTPVYAYPLGSSPFGLLDCAGNVSEWCTDKIVNYRAEEFALGGLLKNPVNLSRHPMTSCILRGGDFLCTADDVRCSVRFYDIPIYYFSNYGFRPVVIPSFDT